MRKIKPITLILPIALFCLIIGSGCSASEPEEGGIIPLEARDESDEMVILANELSERILDTLHFNFQNRTFEMEAINVILTGEREQLHFMIHCLTTGVNFGLPQSAITDNRSRTFRNINRSYIDRLRRDARNSWEGLISVENQRLERIINDVYGESSVLIYTSDFYRDDQGFSDGKTETEHLYYVTSFFTTLGWNVVDVDFIQEVSVPFPDIATLIETVELENLSSIRISLSYDVFLEDDFEIELEATRIRTVLYDFLSEIQEHVGEEITFELTYDSRIEFIRGSGRMVASFRGTGSRLEFTLSELNEFDFTSFFREMN